MTTSLDQVRAGSASHGAMTVFAVIAAVTFLASASAPTPIYHLYQEQMALSPLLVTVVFAAYAFALLLAILSAGSLSDHVGRRPVILASLVANAAAMTLFLYAQSAPVLILARVVQGLAVGAATTTLGAVILDTDRGRGPLINSLTGFVGLTVGALGAGALVAYAPAPTRLVYAVILAATALQAAALAFMPETTAGKPGALASLRPQVAVPPAARDALLAVTPVNVAAWALGGFYLSLMPSLVRAATGLTSPFVGSLVVAALTLTGAVAVFASRGRSARQVLRVGAVILAIGIGATLCGVAAHSAWAMLAGTIVAGVGFGFSFAGSLRTVLPLAEPRERAALLSVYYVESYLAFALPAIGAGLAAPVIGLTATAYVFGAVLAVLALGSLAATGRPKARPN